MSREKKKKKKGKVVIVCKCLLLLGCKYFIRVTKINRLDLKRILILFVIKLCKIMKYSLYNSEFNDICTE